MKSYTSGQLHEIKECVRGPVNTVSVPVYRLLKCLGIVNCRIRPTKRGTKGVKKRHIPVVVTALRPPKPPGLDRRQPCLRRLARVSLCDCDRLNVCLLNCQSICNKAITIKDYIVDNGLDIILLCETWLSSEKEKKICGDILPAGFDIVCVNRGRRRGGGVALIHQKTIALSEFKNITTSTFEGLSVCLTSQAVTIRVLLIYRLIPSRINKLSPIDFHADFQDLFDQHALRNGHLLIVGDFNIHWDVEEDRERLLLNDMLKSANLNQHVNDVTHIGGHTIDLIITKMDDNIVNNISVGSLLSDHFAIHFKLNVGKPPPLREFVQYRKLKSVNHQQLDEDLQNAGLSHESGDDINQLVTQYNDQLSQLLDKHAPMKKAKLVIKPRALWYTPSIAKAKRLRRKLERQWRRTKLTVHQQMFKEQRQQVSSLIRKTRATYYNNKVTECAGDQKALFSIVDKLLHRTDIGALPSGDSNADIASRMSDFFSEKIDNIWNSLPTDHAEVYDIEPLISPLLSAFRPADQEEIRDIIKKSACATCSLDPMPTSFIKQHASVMIPVITNITNESLRSGSVPFDLKEAVIKPLLKKQGLDISNLSNYRPVSNLPFLSKIMERVVVARLKEHMTEHSLCEGMQSAYKSGHSTETALVRVKNDILTSMDKKQCVLLVLL